MKYKYNEFLPANNPDNNVATTGVWKRLFIFERNLNRSPSSAIAYIIRGIGNIAPNKLKIISLKLL